ncbi:hypothetical protein [Bradyrhizobium campsiandrae]|uniref:hypothetical protein n=1 Tax=Bradyrhizobium campsiandrae TaxID=1729892 RepID=UPI0024BF5363|nr:hypothetical protein [Bradyrhizobium campsiandrae]
MPAYRRDHGSRPSEGCSTGSRSRGLKLANIDAIESNEAFAAQALAIMDGIHLPPEKANHNGGAIALVIGLARREPSLL